MTKKTEKTEKIEETEKPEHECSCGHAHNENSSQNPLENLDKDTQVKIQELQIFEHNMQQLMMQKQTFAFEANETNLAVEELKKADGEVFKIIGSQIIMKTTKEKLEKELAHKKELLDLRLKNIEKQEKEFLEKLNCLRDEIMSKISMK